GALSQLLGRSFGWCLLAVDPVRNHLVGIRMHRRFIDCHIIFAHAKLSGPVINDDTTHPELGERDADHYKETNEHQKPHDPAGDAERFGIIALFLHVVITHNSINFLTVPSLKPIGSGAYWLHPSLRSHSGSAPCCLRKA